MLSVSVRSAQGLVDDPSIVSTAPTLEGEHAQEERHGGGRRMQRDDDADPTDKVVEYDERVGPA
eukprot:CAMPEP_0170275110 /NCGR_PEP_ID=MMETSP0116_2-20130129/37529_1 /TAXON_ID=400756 /ORGANISM="Durinskia baltica, Strain CSIRO CS-38" /LENGTH=63 /DNA_ID=CAMNT_0010526361 /DNA_START=289 /DNA_END=480 /DNA_ORIENTATION=+